MTVLGKGFAPILALLLLASCENGLLRERLKALASPAAPTGLDATIGKTSVSLRWDPLPSGASGGELTYTLYYRQGATVAASDATAIKVAGLSASDIPYEVGGLGSLLQYAFALTATNAAGEGRASAVVSATMPDSEAPAPGDGGLIHFANFSTMPPTHLPISWAPASDAGSPAGELEYKLLYSQTRADLATAAEAETRGVVGLDWARDRTSTDISSLTPSTAYYFTLLVRDRTGNVAKYATVEGPARFDITWVSQTPNSGAYASLDAYPASYDFGWLIGEGAWATATFLIKNTGFGRLSMANPAPAIATLSGSYVGSFSIATQPSDFLDPGSTSTLLLQMNTVAMLPTAQVNLPNNDPDRGGYWFSVSGYTS